MAGIASAAGPASRVVFKAAGRLESVRPGGGAFRRIARAPARTSDLAATDDGRWVVAVTNRSLADNPNGRSISSGPAAAGARSCAGRW